MGSAQLFPSGGRVPSNSTAPKFLPAATRIKPSSSRTHDRVGVSRIRYAGEEQLSRLRAFSRSAMHNVGAAPPSVIDNARVVASLSGLS
jgi:hypothetical protein